MPRRHPTRSHLTRASILIALALNFVSFFAWVSRSRTASESHRPVLRVHAQAEASREPCATCCKFQEQLLAQREMQFKALNAQQWDRTQLSKGTRSLDEEGAVKVAVVIPFVRCQISERLPQTLKSWETFPPCLQNTTRVGELHVIFQYNGNLETEPVVLDTLRRLWFGLSPDVRSCFQHVEFSSAALDQREDRYPFGPCVQFYRTFDTLRTSGYDHWLQIEPDVNPIQFGWGSRLLELARENRNCEQWWQLGSSAMYPNVVDKLLIRGVVSVDMHMNGNSVYCLKSKDYDEFRSRVIKTFAPSGCIGFPEVGELGGFDHAMYRFRLLPQNRQYMNNKFSKFRLDDYIMNFGEARFEPDVLLRTNPATMLVHSKYYMVSNRERRKLDAKYDTKVGAKMKEFLWGAYRNELGRTPSKGEEHFFHRMFTSHGNIDSRLAWCLLRQLITACDSGSNLSQTAPPLFECQRVDLLEYFSSSEEVAVTGLYIYYMQAVPGPDAIGFIKGLKSRRMTCTDVASSLCKHPLRPRDLVHSSGPCGLEIRLPKSALPDTCEDWQHLRRGNTLRARCRRKSGGMRRTTLTDVFSCSSAVYNDDGNLQCEVRYEKVQKTWWKWMLSFFFSGAYQVVGPPSTLSYPHVRGLGHVWEHTFASSLRKAFPGTRAHSFYHDYNAMPRDALHLEAHGVEKTYFLPLKVWVTDLHASPMGCNVPLFDSIGAEITAKISFPNCEHFSDSSGQTSCARDRGLQVLKNEAWEGFGLDPCPKALREEFFQHYKSDAEFRGMDAVMCSHPTANCELYLPFNKSIIVYATTRLEFGRRDNYVDWRQPYLSKHSDTRWLEWVRNLQAIASSPGNVVAANNAYDAQYIEYFTGLQAKYIPSWCGGDAESLSLPHIYAPIKLDILLTPYRSNLQFTREEIPDHGWPSQKTAAKSPLDHQVFDDLWKVLEEMQVPFTVRTLQSAFPSGYKSVKELSQFPAAIFIPYQASTMSFFELYRESIPLLVPSKKLLLTWISNHGLLWERVYGKPSILPFLFSFHPLKQFSGYRKSSARSAPPTDRNAQPQ